MIRHLLSTTLLIAVAVLAGCTATSPTPTMAPTLDNSDWTLSAWTLSSMQSSEFGITARFADGTVSGNSAVNRYTGPVTFGPEKQLSIGNLALTRMAGPERAMRAESAYLALLGRVRAYRLDDGQLTLLDQAGNVTLVFDRAPAR